MKKEVAWSLFFIIAVGCMLLVANAPDKGVSGNVVDGAQNLNLKIMTYNFGDWAVHGVTGNSITSTDPNHYRQRDLAQYIKDNQLDIVGLQELKTSVDSYDRIKDELNRIGYPMYSMYSSNGFGKAVFSKYPILNYEVLLDTARTEDHVQAFSIDTDLGSLRVFNVHMDFCHQDPTIHIPLMNILAQDKYSRDTILVIGDFNSGKQSTLVDNQLNIAWESECYAGLTEVYKDACVESETQNPTCHDTYDNYINHGGTETDVNLASVDYILYRNRFDATPIVKDAYSNRDMNSQRLISDHYPVHAEIEFSVATDEICDGEDNNLDGTIDEGCDDDQDGYVDADMPCENSFYTWKYSQAYITEYPNTEWYYDDIMGWIWSNSEGWITLSHSCSEYAGDADDSDASIYPDAPELCDTKDNDLDGETDEGCDDDADRYADADMLCPAGSRFRTWLYDDSYSDTYPNQEWYYDDIMGWIWSNGQDWIWGTLSCDTNSNDIDDEDINIPVSHIPLCTEDNWNSEITPAECPSNETQIRIWNRIGNCEGGIIKPDSEIISCDYDVPTCTSFTYSNWSDCKESGVRTRQVVNTTPYTCQGGNPILSETCNYTQNISDNDSTSANTPSSQDIDSNPPSDDGEIDDDTQQDTIIDDDSNDSQTGDENEGEEAGTIRRFFIRFYCRLMNLFSKEKYQLCLDKYL